MPKKLPIISTLTVLAISTLATTVPTFAEPNETYSVSDLAPLHAQYANDMAECGAYNRYDSNFMDCYNRITNEYRTRYGGKFESMYQLDYNGRMVITGLNPAAGTVRLYIDETKAYRDNAFTFQNLVAFWADGSTNPSPDWNDDVAWDIVDAVLRGEEAPQGVHILYKGIRGEEGWLNPNTEYRTNYTPSGDFTRDNTAKFFFVLGYDTNGVKHLERNAYSGCTDGFTEGDECRLQYTYDGSSASRDYVKTTATTEDAMLIELKNAIKKAEEAEAAAREAENVAREATEAANAAASRATEAETAAREAEAAANQATANAREMEAIAREAEAAAREAESIAREAEIAAREAEAEAIAAKASANATQAEAERISREAAEAVAEANRLATEATRIAEEAIKTADEAIKAAEDAKQTAEAESKKATEIIATTTLEINELNEKIANLSVRISSANSTTQPIEKTIEKTIEKVIEKPIVTSTATNTIPITTPTTITEPTAQEEHVEVPMAATKEPEFPWWIIAFVFSGIALILWWCVPVRKK
ncbi:hypothetical protein J6S55_03445 [Candidatus Saccharibacteria bacterium]|nr:hypothetical protein [Candidatus Saccharibacteria bacterium]